MSFPFVRCTSPFLEDSSGEMLDFKQQWANKHNFII